MNANHSQPAWESNSDKRETVGTHWRSAWSSGATLLLAASLTVTTPALAADLLGSLAQPHEGRSMRATSTMRVGEVRRGNAERKLNPKADPRGDLDEAKGFRYEST